MLVDTNSKQYKGVSMLNDQWAGVFAATLCPFRKDLSIDDENLHQYATYLSGVKGMKGLVCNGHTGEIMGLRAAERAEVTRQFGRAASRKVKIISGVCAEGSFEAIDHALAAKEAGADAILLMPPHHWLRFGRTPDAAVGFFQDVALGANIPIILHQYPSWTKASYSLKELLEIVQIPQVVALKMGTRDMSRLDHEYRVLRKAAPHIPHLSCHDEYLLISLLAGAEGALVGFAGFVPELIIELVNTALSGDLRRIDEVKDLVYRMNKIVYRFGEPSSDAHQRMKVAMTLQGRFSSMDVRPPLRPLTAQEVQRIKSELADSGYDAWQAKRGV